MDHQEEAIHQMQTVPYQFFSSDALQGQVKLLWHQTKYLLDKHKDDVCKNNRCQQIMVPFLKVMVYICLVMSVMLFVDRISMAIVKVFVELLRRKPEKRYKWEAIVEDLELGSAVYPMVLVQIPMYNEREVISSHYFCCIFFFFGCDLDCKIFALLVFMFCVVRELNLFVCICYFSLVSLTFPFIKNCIRFR